MATALPRSQQWKLGKIALLPYDIDVTNNLTVGGTLTVTGTQAFTGNFAVGASKFTVAAASGNTVVAGTLGVTGVPTFTAAVVPTGGIGAAGGFSVSPRLCHSGNNPATATGDGTNAAAVTTETYRVEVFVPANMVVTGVAPFNGTAIAGNVQAWVVDSTGTGIAGAVTASTAAAGTTVYQRIPFTPGTVTLKGPATYWIVIQANNVGYNFRFHAVGSFGADKQTGTTFGTLTVAAAPTTFTAANGPIVSLY